MATQMQLTVDLNPEKLQFFADYEAVSGREDFDGMAHEFQEREHDLNITPQDWAAYRDSKLEVMF